MNERMQAIQEMRRRHSAKTKPAKTKPAKTKPAKTKPTKTKLAVFILESLYRRDERHGRRYEGRVLAQFLDMTKLRNRYTYVRTKTELTAFLKEFAESNIRYLHFSCHGDATSVELTLREELDITELATELSKVAARRRVFLSACLVTNWALARELFDRCPECLSLVGPDADPEFPDATLFWASFYRLMFREDQTKTMKWSDMTKALEKLSGIFGVEMNAFRRGKHGKLDHFSTAARGAT